MIQAEAIPKDKPMTAIIAKRKCNSVGEINIIPTNRVSAKFKTKKEIKSKIANNAMPTINRRFKKSP
jgi:hypothetical protein